MADYALVMSDVELARYRGMAERAVAGERAELELAGIVSGAVVADVGCGPAAMSVEVGRLVGTAGRVIAVEPDERSRATATAVIAASGLSNIDLRAGTATETGLEPASVDVAMLRHVLAHNGGKEQEFVDHLASRVRPGGCVYLVDVDITAVRLVDGPSELDDLGTTYAEFHRARGNDPQVGLRLGRLLHAAGLEELTFQGRYTIGPLPQGVRPPQWAAREAMVAEGIITVDDVERWRRGFEKADEAELRPTNLVPMFVAIGRVPQ